MFHVIGTMTHRTACRSCGATVGLMPTPTAELRRDAVATVIRGKVALPVLADPTVRWECPACDAVN